MSSVPAARAGLVFSVHAFSNFSLDVLWGDELGAIRIHAVSRVGRHELFDLEIELLDEVLGLGSTAGVERYRKAAASGREERGV